MLILVSKIIVIYLIIINIYYYNEKKFMLLHFNHWGDFIRSCVILICFFCLFFVFLRFLNLFREAKSLDLNFFLQRFDLSFLILSLFMLYLLRRNILFIVKLHFIRLHYFGMSSFLPMNRYYKQYSKFYLNVVLKFSHYFYNYCYWVDKLATIIMILLILGDLVFNNMVLNSSLWFAPMYSMFKFIFVITKFVETKQDLIMDYYLIHSSYVGRGYVFPDDDSFYGLTWQSRFPEMCKYEKEVIKV